MWNGNYKAYSYILLEETYDQSRGKCETYAAEELKFKEEITNLFDRLNTKKISIL